MAECAQCKAPLESEFGFVVCPKCGYTNVLGVELAPPEQSSPYFGLESAPVSEPVGQNFSVMGEPSVSEDRPVAGERSIAYEGSVVNEDSVVEEVFMAESHSATEVPTSVEAPAAAESLIEPATMLQFRLELYELDVRALESRVYAIVESLRLEEFWQAHPKKLGYFTLSPLNAHQLSWLLLRLEGVHDRWKVTTL